jgi:hypothetical protein
MNEQLQTQISEILNQIVISVGEVKDYSISQLPDIAQQYITYGIYNSIASFILCLSILIVGIVVLIYTVKRGIFEFNDEFSDMELIIAVFIPSVLLFDLPFLYFSFKELLLVTIAPKVWFILELKNLIS